MAWLTGNHLHWMAKCGITAEAALKMPSGVSQLFFEIMNAVAFGSCLEVKRFS